MVRRILIQKSEDEKLVLDVSLPAADCIVFKLEDGRQIMIQPSESGLYIERINGAWWTFTDWEEME
jgi:hypothetical protein